MAGMQGRVLIIAGSDSGGGAGIQADIKTVTALGGYAMTAITALTAQNTFGVHGIVSVEPAFIRQQISVVVEDIGVDAIKTGMLHSAPVIEAVAAEISPLKGKAPFVIDPVMVAESGASLLDPAALDSLKQDLLPLADVLTPNLPEAEALLDRRIEDPMAMEKAARDLLGLGPAAILLKGGHLRGEEVIDLLATRDDLRRFASQRLRSKSTHGTGCTLASAVATGLAQGLPLPVAVDRARAYLLEAIRSARPMGAGAGSVNHGHTARPFKA